MATNLSIIGSSTGLPSNIVDMMVQAESTRLYSYQDKISALESKKSTFSDLESKLLALKTLSSDLQDSTNWSPRSVESSDETKIAVTAGSTAQAGMHSVAVQRLATHATMVSSTGATSKTTGLTGASTLGFTYNGQNHAVALDAGDTMEDVVDKINALDFGSEDGVSASILYDGSKYRMVVTALDSGAYQRDASGNTTEERVHDITLSSSLNFGGTGTVAQADFGYSQSGLDAKMTVDGVTNIFSGSNTVDEVIPGVTMSLKGLTLDASGNPTNPITITVDNDTTALKDKLQEFVDSYNEIVDYIKNNSNSFKGEGLPRSVVSQLRSVMNTATSGVSGNFSMLAEIGITTDRTTGKLSIDSETLTDAMEQDFSGIAEIFTQDSGAEEGLAFRLESALDLMTKSSDGLLAAKEESLSSMVEMYTTRIDREEARLEKVRIMLTKRFAALESLSSSLQSAGSAMSQSLSRM